MDFRLCETRLGKAFRPTKNLQTQNIMKFHKTPTINYVDKANAKTNKGVSRFERFGRILAAAIKLKEIKSGKSFLQISKKINNNEVSDFVRATH